ncbi:MAG: transaldolase [Deltaproteobacteria bacterium]|nr:transaldolase [Deltaproteobacteria bacterium]
MKVNPLVALGWAGQSPWLDYIHRGMIASGELGRRIAEDGIRGVTSNPTIFEKAVSSGHDYDAQIFALARAGTPLPEAYKAIVTDDIRAAADVLRPVHDASRGDDGYVSLEVDPDLARDTKATIARARELFDAVGRPNVMIKIPGTKEGLPAVEETIASGVPVNITLIFSAKRYEEVADAYMRGLERLLSSGGDPRKVASVASFFVSRIDTAVDALLLSTVERWPGSPKAETALSLLGKTAVASARVAYGKFLALTEYSDVKYVEELIGPDTVNTMPPQTMDAFRDHGTVADVLSGAEEEAKAVLDDYGLMETGIEEVCARLEEEGVKSFLDSYRKLLAAVEKRLSSASA